MNRNLLVTALIATAAFGSSFAASAQTNAAATTQRDVKQEQRIENGLRNGTITARENAKLQSDEARVDRLEAKALKDGKMTAAERAQVTEAQNKASRDIHTATTNGVNGNPLSASSQRAQADVQRNIAQEQRINQGVRSGSLTNREAASLERGQAHVDAREAHAGADGHISAREQRNIQHAENRQSARIYNKKHNAAVKD